MAVKSTRFSAAHCPASCVSGRGVPHVRPLQTSRRPQFLLPHCGHSQSAGLEFFFFLENPLRAGCVPAACPSPLNFAALLAAFAGASPA
eukprot:CAMPEP_0185205460 /NCGR_PEP_ID=MMETSP1140-20130426/56687_1 /TAXON_ID=298111 /ORGANISM="Pavlova sp., Strain CCMP459" /LENGTH=88 /DNA_ID=CAMNT_0027773061 /DNA_START=248 /DNA_END=511 /DNA_ORIENTATION=+